MTRSSLGEIKTGRIACLAPSVNVNRQSTTCLGRQASGGHRGPIQVLTRSSRREIDQFDNRLSSSQVKREWKSRDSHASSARNVRTLSESNRTRISAQTLDRVGDLGGAFCKVHRLCIGAQNPVH